VTHSLYRTDFCIADQRNASTKRNHRERMRVVALPQLPDGSNRRDRRTVQREAVLGLWVLFARELEEGGRGNGAAVAIGQS
jgi:hypothetical protein